MKVGAERKSRKVMVHELITAFDQLKAAETTLIKARNQFAEAQKRFDILTKRASGATCKAFIEETDLHLEVEL